MGLLNYRITVSGMTLEVKASGQVSAVNKVLQDEAVKAHINNLLSRYNRFTVSIDSVTP